MATGWCLDCPRETGDKYCTHSLDCKTNSDSVNGDSPLILFNRYCSTEGTVVHIGQYRR